VAAHQRPIGALQHQIHLSFLRRTEVERWEGGSSRNPADEPSLGGTLPPELPEAEPELTGARGARVAQEPQQSRQESSRDDSSVMVSEPDTVALVQLQVLSL